MKATTVHEIRQFIRDVAQAEGIKLQEAAAQVATEWEMACFMGAWDNPSAEVLVPDDMPVGGMIVPGVKVYI